MPKVLKSDKVLARQWSDCNSYIILLGVEINGPGHNEPGLFVGNLLEAHSSLWEMRWGNVDGPLDHREALRTEASWLRKFYFSESPCANPWEQGGNITPLTLLLGTYPVTLQLRSTDQTQPLPKATSWLEKDGTLWLEYKLPHTLLWLDRSPVANISRLASAFNFPMAFSVDRNH